MSTQYDITLDMKRCTKCGLCEAFCPVDVFEMIDGEPVVTHPEYCWGCGTCYGQCASDSITITGSHDGADDSHEEKAPHIDPSRTALFAEWEQAIREVLGLRWRPVGVHFVAQDELLPDIKAPAERLRFCQSLLAARRGRSFVMESKSHACPDGTSILGLTEMPKKLESGELYILFNKLHDVEAAQSMVRERPMLPERSMRATAVAPLGECIFEPDVVAITAQPEQIMWLCMSLSYYTGHRFDFHASGYNAQCVEVCVLPYTSGEPNISFGCYGCRASSDVSDDLMFMGVPTKLIPEMVKGLKELNKKAIPQSRSKVYLPPFNEA